MKKVLVVEDDQNIAELIGIHLNDMDCEVTTVHDGRKGLLAALNNPYDLMILDLMLPGMQGMEVCRQLRDKEVGTPIMMLTAKSEEIDKVLGLETGADDYLTKPFSVLELQARVRAIFRRIEMSSKQEEKQEENPMLRFGDLVIDTAKRKVTLKGERIELTPKEFELLMLLAEHPGTTYSRERILNLVWGYEFEGYEHTVNSHINRLRAKIEEDIRKPRYVLTTWGVGYRFSDTE